MLLLDAFKTVILTPTRDSCPTSVQTLNHMSRLSFISSNNLVWKQSTNTHHKPKAQEIAG